MDFLLARPHSPSTVFLWVRAIVEPVIARSGHAALVGCGPKAPWDIGGPCHWQISQGKARHLCRTHLNKMQERPAAKTGRPTSVYLRRGDWQPDRVAAILEAGRRS